jgi:hypothetical protein
MPNIKPLASCPTLDPPARRELVVRAEVDPATLSRYLKGAPVRALSRRRIERAAGQLGLQLTRLIPKSNP